MTKSFPKRFNLRVYGLMLLDDAVLISDERYGKFTFTKFPGGGLEFGEGPLECLKREFMEEANQPIEVLDHFYTTEGFYASSFRPQEQVISIYYMVQPLGPITFPITSIPFNFDQPEGNEVVFRWCPLDELDPDFLRFPIDKIVAKRLKEVRIFP